MNSIGEECWSWIPVKTGNQTGLIGKTVLHGMRTDTLAVRKRGKKKGTLPFL